MKPPKPIKPKKGQESVWDYPRPPKLELFKKLIEIYFNDTLIASTYRAYRVLETSHPPVYYIPDHDVENKYLVYSDKITFCEFKGKGAYYDIQVADRLAEEAAWFYDNPKIPFVPIRNHLAFYAEKMDDCFVDGIKVTPQPGEFYGGWITPDIVGPFKGEPGTWGW